MAAAHWSDRYSVLAALFVEQTEPGLHLYLIAVIGPDNEAAAMWQVMKRKCYFFFLPLPHDPFIAHPLFLASRTTTDLTATCEPVKSATLTERLHNTLAIWIRAGLFHFFRWLA